MAAGAADLDGYGTPRRRSLAWGSRSLRMGSELHILALLPVLSLLAVQARCKGGGVRGHTPAAIKPLLPWLSLREGLTPSNCKPKQTFVSLSNTPVCSFGRSKKSKEYRGCWSDRGWCLVQGLAMRSLIHTQCLCSHKGSQGVWTGHSSTAPFVLRSRAVPAAHQALLCLPFTSCSPSPLSLCELPCEVCLTSSW